MHVSTSLLFEKKFSAHLCYHNGKRRSFRESHFYLSISIPGYLALFGSTGSHGLRLFSSVHAALNISVCALWSLHVICAHSSCLKAHSEKDRGVVTCVLHWWRYENSFLTGDCSFLLGCQWLSGNIPRSESIHITPQNEQCMARPGHPELDSFTSDCFSETLEWSICSNAIVKNIHPTSC